MATVQVLSTLSPIEGKDRIELARVLGWNVIVEKGYKVGDKIIYIEIDSLLPANNPDFEFLRKRCYVEKYNAMRIKTMKMNGIYSQGLVLPISILPKKDYKVGDDVTEILGITKFDPELEEENKLAAHKRRPWIIRFLARNKWIKDHILFPPHKSDVWPVFISKTDETRIQALGQNFLNSLSIYNPLYISEKVDGQSATFGIYKKKFYVCSRNMHLVLKDNSNHWIIATKYSLEKKLKSLKKNIYIQGEICGPNIQKNKYNLTEKKLFIFNAYDIDKKKFYSLGELNDLSNFLKVPLVPFIDMVEIHEELAVFPIKGTTMPATVDAFVNYANGQSLLFPTEREGIVVRPYDSLKGNGHTGPVLGFKAISPEFTIKWDL